MPLETNSDQQTRLSVRCYAGSINSCLEALVLYAAARQQWERAPRLLRAAETQHEKLGTPLLTAERAVHDAAIELVRAALDEEAFAHAWTTGQFMSLEQAVGEALEPLD